MRAPRQTGRALTRLQQELQVQVEQQQREPERVLQEE